jgi:Family of unknown function (DUF6515)
VVTNERIFQLLLAIGMISFFIAGGLFGGVAQLRSANSTNTQIYVNPNYSNQATVYRQEDGSVSIQPGQAVIAGQAESALYNGYGAVVVGDYYDDYSGLAGSTPGTMSIPIGTILEYAPSSAVPVMVKGSRYYYENNVFLAEVFDGSSVVYQVVPAPLGAVVTQLPVGCIVQNYNGRSFELCGKTYYQQVAGGYQVVAVN